MDAFTILPIELWQPVLALTNLSLPLLQSSHFPSTVCWTTCLVDRCWRMRAAYRLLPDIIRWSHYAASQRCLFDMLTTQEIHRLLFGMGSLSDLLEHEMILENFLTLPVSVLIGELGGHALHTMCFLFQHAEAAYPFASLLPHGYMFGGYLERSEWSNPSPRQHWDVIDQNYCGPVVLGACCDVPLLVVFAHLVTLASPISSFPAFTSSQQMRETVSQLITRYTIADRAIYGTSGRRATDADVDFAFAQFLAQQIVGPAFSIMPTALSLPLTGDSSSSDVMFALHTLLVDLGLGRLVRPFVPWLSTTPPFWIWTVFGLTDDDVSEEMVESEMKRIAAEVGWETGVLEVASRVKIPHWSVKMKLRVRWDHLVAAEYEGDSESVSGNQQVDVELWDGGHIEDGVKSEWASDSLSRDVAGKDWWQ